METNGLRNIAITAIAPIAWGSTYLISGRFVPADAPLFDAVIRALPAGLLLFALRRRLPRGHWWWKSAVLAFFNVALFFPLIFIAAFELPGGLAATLQATGPLVVMALAFVLIGEQVPLLRIVAGLIGIAGVGLLVLRNPGELSGVGLMAALGSVLATSLGFVLVKRWQAPVDMVTLTSWQLILGGLMLLPVSFLFEGHPPTLDASGVLAFVWLGGVGTALACVCWFRGVSKMPAGSTALIGLLNPLVGTLLGVAFAGEVFGWPQAAGMGLVILGVVIGQRMRRRTKLAHGQPRRSPVPQASVDGLIARKQTERV